MANRKSGSRQNKQTKTIDLKANPSEDESVRDLDDAGGTSSSGYDILKTEQEQEPGLESLSEEEAAAVLKKPQNEDEPDGSGIGKGQEETASSGSDDFNSNNPPVAPVNRKSSGGMGSLLLSAVLGGGVALGGASLIGQNSVLQSLPVIGGLFAGSSIQEAENAKVAELSARLTALTSQIENLQASAGQNLDTNDVADEALELAKAAATASEATSAKLDDLAKQLMDNPGGAPVDVGALKAAIAGDQAQLVDRIVVLEAAGRGGVSKVLEDDISGLKDQISKLSSLESSSARLSETVSGMDTRLKAVETSINETILPSMESVQAAAGAAVESQKVARSVSARALGAVLENGGSFSSELAAAEALIGQTQSISELKILAGKGIPTLAALASEFRLTSDRILFAEVAPAEEQGFVSKLFSSAKTLVKVRPAGPVDGDTNTAIVSRIAAALASGDIPAALAEWNTLGEDAKAVSGEWETKAMDRLEAEKHLNSIIGELGLSSPNQG